MPLVRDSHTRPIAGVLLAVVVIGVTPCLIGPSTASEPPRQVPGDRYAPTPAELLAAYQRAQQPSGQGRVYKDRVTPHWLADDSHFWYRNDLKGGAKEFLLVNADAGTRGPAFDHTKMAAAISEATGKKYTADRLPFDTITFTDDQKAIRFKVADTTWTCDLARYQCEKAAKGADPTSSDSAPPAEVATALLESIWPDGPVVAPEENAREGLFQDRPRRDARPAKSPDGKWTAVVKENNVVLRNSDGQETPLSTDGKTGSAYGSIQWSPDSTALVAFRTELAQTKEVHLIESSPRGGGRAVLKSRPYALPGDTFTRHELHLFDVATGKERKVDVEPIDFGWPGIRWSADGHTFSYQKVDRGHQRFRLIEVNAHTGTVRTLIDEKSKTFIWTAHFDGMDFETVNWLSKTPELIHASEKSGWRHLYLVDTKAGRETNPITSGEYVIRGIDKIDEDKRQVWFRASGKNPGQDPYLIHSYRVNFDGTGLVALTEGNGTHRVQYSPNRKYLIDTYSRVDMAPVTELRRAADGRQVTPLEIADIGELKANGWEPPEVFTAKGRDQTTEIWGVIHRPRKFDPSKKYPVIEYIYAGPHGSFVPKAFSARRRFRQLTELGFIVVQIDGMGTANRSKAFHDVCWQNLKDAGFPDRILWHKAVAAKYPYYDAIRVGIYGTSAGGQSAMGALLFHGDFYSVAMAACGCHDNRMDKASWNEQWMGYPVGPHYAACSNVDNAHRLTGKLLLIVGEQDTNVPPESTFRVVDALIKAGKDFDLLVVPGMGHSDGGQYGQRRMQDFFVRHLLGVEPPDRNKSGK